MNDEERKNEEKKKVLEVDKSCNLNSKLVINKEKS